MGKKVALGMSGGVDSSVSALLLKEQGYDVTGVFLECWRSPGCRAEEDRKDALAVALQVGIPFTVLDFKDAYKGKVVEYFFDEYEKGRTPNPDVLCNKEIKFGLFYEWAMKEGFDYVATGHYAQIGTTEDNEYQLRMSTDAHKDQTYFLYRLRGEQLPHILFPIGHIEKAQVRLLATEKEITVASKPDSTGICFIGEINVHDFLRERLGENPGEVVDTKGRVIGRHKGLWFYTIGQRHGFELAPTLPGDTGLDKHAIPPFYVIAKEAHTNRLIVGFGAETYRNTFTIADTHWITGTPKEGDADLTVRIRHTGQLYACTLKNLDTDAYEVTVADPIQGIAAGQSAVLYRHTTCLGGGVIHV